VHTNAGGDLSPPSSSSSHRRVTTEEELSATPTSSRAGSMDEQVEHREQM
jgi:hypothetical protein